MYDACFFAMLSLAGSPVCAAGCGRTELDLYEEATTEAGGSSDASSSDAVVRDAGLADGPGATVDAEVPPEVSTPDAACHRDASALPAPPGVCCVTQDDCQSSGPYLSCCVRDVCVYCGPK